MYASQDQGKFPPSLAALIDGPDAQEIPAAVMVCPSSKDSAPDPTSTTRAAADMKAGGHLSYIYVGAGLTDQSSPDTVLAYEPLTNHDGDGSNVAYTDAHVEWHSAAEVKMMIASLNAGKNPPTTRP